MRRDQGVLCGGVLLKICGQQVLTLLLAAPGFVVLASGTPPCAAFVGYSNGAHAAAWGGGTKVLGRYLPRPAAKVGVVSSRSCPGGGSLGRLQRDFGTPAGLGPCWHLEFKRCGPLPGTIDNHGMQVG